MKKFVLNLENYEINDITIKDLVDLIKEVTTLRDINLHLCLIDDFDFMKICKSLAGNTTLRSLDIGANSLSYTSIESLTSLLATNSCKLQHLNLSFNVFRSKGSSAIVQMLSTNNSLVSIDLSTNVLYSKDIEGLGAALSKNATLKELSLKMNVITDISELMKGLELNCTVESLDLSQNNISPISSLRSYIEVTSTLKKLCLERCCIYGKKLTELRYALRTNTTIEWLDLSRNPLGSKFGINSVNVNAGLDIGVILFFNTTLTYVNLSNTKLGNNEFEYIAYSLSPTSFDASCHMGIYPFNKREEIERDEDTILETLDLSYNDIPKSHRRLLSIMHKNTPSLTNLRIDPI